MVDVTRGIWILIAVMLERIHQGVFKRGVAEDTWKHLLLGPHYGVISVLKHYCLHQSLGLKYTGDQIVDNSSNRTLGRKPKLAVDSIEAQILADNLEDGVSLS